MFDYGLGKPLAVKTGLCRFSVNNSENRGADSPPAAPRDGDGVAQGEIPE
jgi:hypothetical protein